MYAYGKYVEEMLEVGRLIAAAKPSGHGMVLHRF